MALHNCGTLVHNIANIHFGACVRNFNMTESRLYARDYIAEMGGLAEAQLAARDAATGKLTHGVLFHFFPVSMREFPCPVAAAGEGAGGRAGRGAVAPQQRAVVHGAQRDVRERPLAPGADGGPVPVQEGDWWLGPVARTGAGYTATR